MINSLGELALIIAGISAGISALSLIVSYRAYKRDAPRVQIKFDNLRYVAQDIVLKVENHGPLAIQITEGEVYGWRNEEDFHDASKVIYRRSRYYNLPGREEPFSSPPEHAEGPSLPYTLEGYHDVRWLLPRNGEYTKHIDKIQVRITLGTGKVMWSPKEKVYRSEI